MGGSSTTSLYYEGPQGLIVELEREVTSGDVILDVDNDLVPKLLQVVGIREATTTEERKARKDAEKAQEDAAADDGGEADSSDGAEASESGKA